MSLLFDPVTNYREQYKLLTTLLWENNHQKAAFTASRTPNTDTWEFYWYTLDSGATDKVQRLFYATKEGMLIDVDNELYSIIEMAHYKATSAIQVLLVLQNTEDVSDHISYMGVQRPPKDTKPSVVMPQKAKYTNNRTYVHGARRKNR